MSQRPVFAFLLALALASGSGVAQRCPDLGVVPVPERLVPGPSTVCGIGLEITIGGVTYTSQQGFCPSFVMIMPRHAQPAQARLGYRYVPAPPKDVYLQAYECYGWIWTACRRNGPARPINTVTDYADEPCVEVRPQSEALQGE